MKSVFYEILLLAGFRHITNQEKWTWEVKSLARHTFVPKYRHTGSVGFCKIMKEHDVKIQQYIYSVSK